MKRKYRHFFSNNGLGLVKICKIISIFAIHTNLLQIMKIQKLLSFVLSLTSLLAVAGACTEKVDLGQGGGDDEGTVFTIEATSIQGTSANLIVKHNGTSKDTYDVFWYEGSAASAESEINKEIVKIKNGEVTVQKGTNSEIVATGLKGKTLYTAVVFGVDKEGNTYGKSANVEFATEKAPVELSVEVTKYDTNSITISVTSSTADPEDTWYAMISQDAQTDPAAQLEKAMKAESNLASKLRYGSSSVTFTGLSTFTGYVIIVGAATAEGKANGEPVWGIQFTALDTQVNPNWTMSYKFGMDYSDNSYPNNVRVESTDNARYAIGLFQKSEMTESGYTLDEICKGIAGDLLYTIDYYMQMNSNYTFEQLLDKLTYKGSASEAFNMFYDDYVAYAVEIDDKGYPTGKYATTEFKPEAAKADFKKWEGLWNYVGANGKAFNETVVAEYYVNETLMIYNGGTTGLDLAAFANWDYKTGEFYLKNFNYIDDVTLNTANGELTVPLYYAGIFDEGNIAGNDEKMCAAGELDANNSTTLTALEWTASYSDGTKVTATCTMAGDIVYGDLEGKGDNWYILADFKDWLSFPITITRTGDLPPANSSAMVMKSRRNVEGAADVESFVKSARVHSKKEIRMDNENKIRSSRFAKMSERPMMVDRF